MSRQRSASSALLFQQLEIKRPLIPTLPRQPSCQLLPEAPPDQRHVRAVERQEPDQPEEPVAAGKAARDDEGERPEDQDDADVEAEPQAGPGGRQDRDVGRGVALHLGLIAQAGDGAAIDIGEGIPFLERVEPLAAREAEARLRGRVDDIMAAKAAQDTFKAHIIQRGEGLAILQRADEQTAEIKRHGVFYLLFAGVWKGL